MSWTIHHVNIPAYDVRVSAQFYTDILGMVEAAWEFPPNARVVSREADRLTLFPTATGARGPNPGLHLVKPDPAFAHEQGFIHNPTIGGHIAYQTEDLAPVIER
ncbi:MAG: VOC family protein, partial [Pseudomonadota bacterium]